MGSSARAKPELNRPVDELQERIRQIVGEDVDAGMLRHALTHRSYAYENGGVPNNERLEFLGDSVLGLVVTDSLFADHPDLPEGQLAKLRASVVNMRALAVAATELGVGDYLLLGRGEESTGGRAKASILADTMEALIGVVYLAHGMDVARVFVHHLIDPLMEQAVTLGAGLDWKTSLQEVSSALALGLPEYRVTQEGPDHEKIFTAHVHVGGELLGEGVGRSKKEAEQKAAETAWRILNARAIEAAEEEPAVDVAGTAGTAGTARTAGMPSSDG